MRLSDLKLPDWTHAAGTGQGAKVPRLMVKFRARSVSLVQRNSPGAGRY
jgi:hypothetical protein